jgi:hypothetical protein
LHLHVMDAYGKSLVCLEALWRHNSMKSSWAVISMVWKYSNVSGINSVTMFRVLLFYTR